MNFPLENPVFQFLYWLLNTPGLGGLAVAIFVSVALVIYTRTLFWIAAGAQANEREVYTYPTSALHHHGEESEP